MVRLVILVSALVLPGTVMAQGVNEPTTPSNTIVIVNPPEQPSPSTATRNIPTQAFVPPVRVHPAHAYHPAARGSGGR